MNRVLEAKRTPRPERITSHHSDADIVVGKGERTVLRAIAQYPDGAERDQLTVLTGYKRSTRDTYIQRLSLAGLVEVSGSGIRTTDAGVDALGSDFEPLPQGEELQAYWLDRLPEGERRILEVLLKDYPESVGRDVLSEETQYKRSTRDTYLQRLQSRRLVEDVGRGEVRASANLFSGALV
jgi:Mn-dependent DtxR family transcriptional regulator